ncbi:hypothetical protein [Actinomadura decatromicini]|uniref:Uncharacterized protein n=1 Tax=Actinomadura decatromicini TaxID=2604572 RepID=A0A5D3FDI1_9ACTN|nr:hypothetical protein [Actinomadura decatromicini]TYK46014.1 hypothetical protein FXF68_27780 [Actinomadura decatromicini]
MPWHDDQSSGPFRITKNQSTKYVVVTRNVQICFNISGSNLNKGYMVYILRFVEPGWPHQQMWGTTYWGPKSKTCSPWIDSDGANTAAIFTDSGANPVGDFWLYYN